jgi:hypothetical protein
MGPMSVNDSSDVAVVAASFVAATFREFAATIEPNCAPTMLAHVERKVCHGSHRRRRPLAARWPSRSLTGE